MMLEHKSNYSSMCNPIMLESAQNMWNGNRFQQLRGMFLLLFSFFVLAILCVHNLEQRARAAAARGANKRARARARATTLNIIAKNIL